jgi:membrane protein
MAESQLSAEQQVESMWHLGGLTIKQLAKGVWKEIDHDDVINRAAELAYNFLLSVFPLLLFLLALLGMLASAGSALRQQLFTSLSQALPSSASELISKTLNEVTKSSGGGKLTFGIAFFLWSASSGVSTMMSVLNAAYDVRESRPYYKTKAISLGLTLALLVLVVVALLLVVFGGKFAGLASTHLGLGNGVVIAWKVVQVILALFFVSMAFAVLYYFGPDVKEQHWYWITPGSIIGVLLWLAASYGLRLYLHYFNSYSKTYGSLGAVIILLLWFYISGLAFLVGAEVNAEIEHAAAHRGHPEAKAEGEKRAA